MRNSRAHVGSWCGEYISRGRPILANTSWMKTFSDAKRSIISQRTSCSVLESGRPQEIWCEWMLEAPTMRKCHRKAAANPRPSVPFDFSCQPEWILEESLVRYRYPAESAWKSNRFVVGGGGQADCTRADLQKEAIVITARGATAGRAPKSRGRNAERVASWSAGKYRRRSVKYRIKQASAD
jgi:hypothetical protein